MYKKILTISALVFLSDLASAMPSLCVTGETTVFTCARSKKIASVCAAYAPSGTLRYVQYRFGAGTPELAIPPIDSFSADQMHGYAVNGNHGGSEGIEFHNGEYGYVVSTSWDAKDPTDDSAGVDILRNNVPYSNFSCAKWDAGGLRDFVANEKLETGELSEQLLFSMRKVPVPVEAWIRAEQVPEEQRTSRGVSLKFREASPGIMTDFNGDGVSDWAGVVVNKESGLLHSYNDTTQVYVLLQKRDGTFALDEKSLPFASDCESESGASCNHSGPTDVMTEHGDLHINSFTRHFQNKIGCSENITHEFKRIAGSWRLTDIKIDLYEDLGPIKQGEERSNNRNTKINYNALTGATEILNTSLINKRTTHRRIALPRQTKLLKEFGNDDRFALPQSNVLPQLCDGTK
jgi:hypothetical protein